MIPPTPTLAIRWFTESARDERGLSTVEYVIILVLIAASSIGAWQVLGGAIKSKLSASETTIRTMDGTSDGNSVQSPNANQGQTASNPTPASQAATPTKQAAGKVKD